LIGWLLVITAWRDEYHLCHRQRRRVLRLHQLQLLAHFLADHREALLRLGICRRAARPADGFEFVTL
jgi:hypothetical protein